MKSTLYTHQKRASSHWIVTMFCGIAVTLGACDSQESALPLNDYLIVIEARDDASEMLAGVEVEANQQRSEPSDANGKTSVSLRGWEGEEKSLRIHCPEGHLAEPPTLQVTLSTLRAVGSGASTRVMPRSVTCVPSEHTIVLAIVTRGAPALPLVDAYGEDTGRVLGKTGARGITHLAFRLPPSSSLGIRIDTRSAPDLIPQNPVHHFEVGHEDGVLLLEQAFSEAPRRVVKKQIKRPTTLAPAPRRLPVRIR